MPTTKKKTDSSIGNRFRELRNLLKKTQAEMAEDLEATQANLSQIEGGKCLPTFTFQKKLADTFPEINFNWLIYGEGAPLRNSENHRIARQAEEKAIQRVEKNLQKTISDLMASNEKLQSDNSKLINALTSKKR